MSRNLRPAGRKLAECNQTCTCARELRPVVLERPVALTLDVPAVVLDRLAGQLDIADPSCVKRYTERRTTPFEHRDEIKAAYGLREFTEPEEEFTQWARLPQLCEVAERPL